jgi:hypothetical protein
VPELTDWCGAHGLILIQEGHPSYRAISHRLTVPMIFGRPPLVEVPHRPAKRLVESGHTANTTMAWPPDITDGLQKHPPPHFRQGIVGSPPRLIGDESASVIASRYCRASAGSAGSIGTGAENLTLPSSEHVKVAPLSRKDFPKRGPEARAPSPTNIRFFTSHTECSKIFVVADHGFSGSSSHAPGSNSR